MSRGGGACLLLALPAAAQNSAAVSSLQEAARLDQAGRCQESDRIYQQILSRQPSPSIALLNNTGNHYLACRQPDKARAYFERVVAVEPGHANANLQLARLDMAAGQFRNAEARLAPMVRAGGGGGAPDFDVLFLLGRAQARSGGPAAAARQTLEAALSLRPDDLGAMVEAGLANAASGDFPRAVFLLARARARAPREPGIALALARAAEDAGYYGDAVAAYDHYLALSPQDASSRRDRARALAFTASGQAQGKAALDVYIAAAPRDPLGHLYAAQVCWSNDAAAALDHLAEALRLDATLAAAHVARAWLLYRLGRGEEALPHLEAALKIAPNDVRALDQLGVVLLGLGRAAEAEPHLRKAAALAPADADVALHLGRALIDQDKEQEGQQWLSAYEKLRPARQRDARRQAGMIELATLDPAGRRAREIERFRSMTRSRPDDPLLQLHLAGLLLSDGQTAAALNEYAALLKAANLDAALWARAGRTLLEAGEIRAALPFLDRAVRAKQLEPAEALLAEAFSMKDGAQVAEAFAGLSLPPAVARAAGLLLAARFGRTREALDLLGRAAAADRDIGLVQALVLALGNDPAGARRLEQLEKQWPDWDRPAAALRLLRTPKNGEQQRADGCATLREWVFGTCTGSGVH